MGGGLSGITAALSAAQNGAQVILLEQKEYLGGNSVLSTGDFLLGGTSLQAAQALKTMPMTSINGRSTTAKAKKIRISAG